MFCDIRGVQGGELQLVDNKLENYQEPNYNINIYACQGGRGGGILSMLRYEKGYKIL